MQKHTLSEDSVIKLNQVGGNGAEEAETVKVPMSPTTPARVPGDKVHKSDGQERLHGTGLGVYGLRRDLSMT